MGNPLKCFLAGLAMLVVGLGPSLVAHAADRTNLPLKNWGGFALRQHWAYDALEKLSLAGLTDRVVLNTRPLSRVEAARILDQALQRLEKDALGEYNNRGYLEELVEQLIDEFRPELAAMGKKSTLDFGAPPGFVSGKPVDHLQLQFGWADDRPRLAGSQGERFEDGTHGKVALDARAQIGDFLSFYLHPEFHGDDEITRVRIQNGYAKLTLWNVELLAGRDAIWWGPGYHGSMLFSNNAAPLDQVRIGAAEPFLLPWVLKYLGPMKLVFLIARLEQQRDHPFAKVAGMRINLTPVPFLELGLSRAVQFEGRNGPRPSLGDWPEIIFVPSVGDDRTKGRFRNNQLAALDVTLRIPRVSQYLPLVNDLKVYGEMGWDDTCCNDMWIPLKPGGLVGVFATGLLGLPDVDGRVEYARTTSIQYNHTQFTDGFSYRRAVLSHFIGNEGSDLFARVTNRLTPDFLLGLELNFAQIGPTANDLQTRPREKRTALGVDLSYRLSKRQTLFGAYQFTAVKNRDFVTSSSDNDHLLRLEFTHSF
jgi:hypothetical protein